MGILKTAMACLEAKFPQILEWGSTEDITKAAAFIKVTPQVISVLNYEKEFGHTELVTVER